MNLSTSSTSASSRPRTRSSSISSPSARRSRARMPPSCRCRSPSRCSRTGRARRSRHPGRGLARRSEVPAGQGDLVGDRGHVAKAVTAPSLCWVRWALAAAGSSRRARVRPGQRGARCRGAEEDRRLAKALSDHAGARLRGRARPGRRQGWRGAAQAFKRKLKAQKWKALSKKNQAPPIRGRGEGEAGEECGDLGTRLHRPRRISEKPRNLIGMVKDLPRCRWRS